MSKNFYYQTLPAMLIVGLVSLAIHSDAYSATTLSSCSVGQRVNAPGNTCPGIGLFRYTCRWSNGTTTTPTSCGTGRCPSVCGSPPAGTGSPGMPGAGSGSGSTSGTGEIYQGGTIPGSGRNVSKSGGGVKPVAPAKANYNYQSQTTNSSTIYNFDYYSTLKPCPPDRNSEVGINKSSGSGSVYDTSKLDTSRIEDINRQMPYSTSGGTTQYSTPDDQCYVRSFVRCTSGSTSIIDHLPNIDSTGFCKPSDTIQYANAAVCPDNFVQVGSFDMQPEITYNPSEQYITSPSIIKTLTDYQYYRDEGWECKVNSYNKTWVSPCQGAGPAQILTYTANFARDVPYNLKAVTNNASDVGVVMFGNLDYWDRNCYTSNTTCSGNVDPICNLVGYPSSSNYTAYYPTSSTISIIHAIDGNQDQTVPSAIAYSTRFEFYYGHVSCTLPKGFFFSKNKMAPRSLICARIKTQYDKLNVKPAK